MAAGGLQHGPHLHGARGGAPRHGGAARPARHGRHAMDAARRVPRRSRADAEHPASRWPRPCGALASHPAVLMFAVGNEIPPSVVRWHGQRPHRALPPRSLRRRASRPSPDSLLTYVNFPPTEYLDLDCFDVCSFNVYLHREADLRAYLARLQHVAGAKPLPAGRGRRRQHPRRLDGQAGITAMHVRAAFEEGACGAVAFSWTDEWWRGGHTVDDWAIRPGGRGAPAEAGARRRVAGVRRGAVHGRARAPLAEGVGGGLRLQRRRHDRRLPGVAGRADLSRLRGDCRQRRLDGRDRRDRAAVSQASGSSTSRTAASAPRATSASPHATGEIVAYTDADVRVDPDWLTYLVQPMLSGAFVGSGGPNVVPPDDDRGWRSAWRARRAARRTCCSTTASPSTCRAATWRSAATRSCRSAASTPSTCAPATTSTSAGGCRRKGCGSASRRRRWSGITIAPRCRPTGGSRSATAKARPGSTRTTPRSSCAARCCGAATSTARCRSCAR